MMIIMICVIIMACMAWSSQTCTPLTYMACYCPFFQNCPLLSRLVTWLEDNFSPCFFFLSCFGLYPFHLYISSSIPFNISSVEFTQWILRLLCDVDEDRDYCDYIHFLLLLDFHCHQKTMQLSHLFFLDLFPFTSPTTHTRHNNKITGNYLHSFTCLCVCVYNWEPFVVIIYIPKSSQHATINKFWFFIWKYVWCTEKKGK